MGQDPAPRDWGVMLMSILEDSSAENTLPPAGPSIIDGQPTRAPVVVAQHGDEVAIWQVDLAGNPCGAWVLRCDDPGAARRLLSICDRRGLIAVNPDGPVAVMLKWAKDGDVPIDRETLESRLCLLSSLVDETRVARDKYVDGVRDFEVRGGKRLAPLVWKGPVPEPVAQTLDEWAAALGVPQMDVQSVADEARQVAALARYALGLWIDTEGRRNRRKYLRDEFGPSQPLPLTWREAVVSAHQSPFDLPATSGVSPK
jgi:hypothetical protein